MSVLFYVDTDAPNFGETSEDSIALGIEEAPHYGPTKYMTSIRQTFRDKKKALEYFHTMAGQKLCGNSFKRIVARLRTTADQNFV